MPKTLKMAVASRLAVAKNFKEATAMVAGVEDFLPESISPIVDDSSANASYAVAPVTWREIVP